MNAPEKTTQIVPESALVRYMPCDDLDDAIDDEGDTVCEPTPLVPVESEGGEPD